MYWIKEIQYPEYLRHIPYSVCHSAITGNIDLEVFKPIQRPNEMFEMARQIGEQMEERSREDIESWAERLAEEVSKATD